MAEGVACGDSFRAWRERYVVIEIGSESILYSHESTRKK